MVGEGDAQEEYARYGLPRQQQSSFHNIIIITFSSDNIINIDAMVGGGEEGGGVEPTQVGVQRGRGPRFARRRWMGADGDGGSQGKGRTSPPETIPGMGCSHFSTWAAKRPWKGLISG